MTAVRTYRAVDFPLKLYGFWPADLAALCGVFVFVHGVFNSLRLDLALLIPGLWLAWRARKRPPRSGSSLLAFAMSPRRYGLGLVREVYMPGRKRP
jgi:hypothetical protein